MENILDTRKVAAILMASGFSRRFGSENKLLVPFRGKPLARYSLDLACSMKQDTTDNSPAKDCFSDIFFVVQDIQTAALARGLPVTVLRNNAPEKGRRESVRLGTGAAEESGYYFFFPCDQPFLDTETVRLMLAARRPGCIVEPCFQGRHGSLDYHGSLVCHGSPSLFSALFRDELLTLGEGEKPKIIKARHPDALIDVEIPNRLALLDIDRPEDIEQYGKFTFSRSTG
jgi:molybdenum cofactor cytidylyltransferase